MSYASLITESKNQVGVIRFNRPDAHNALSTTMLEDIAMAVEAFDNDDSVRAIVLCSSGDYFTAGVDLQEFSQNLTDVASLLDRQKAAMLSLSRVRKPLIAAAAGYVFGQGIELLLNCDIVLAADNLCLAIPDASLGIVPGIGLEKKLLSAVGRAKTMEMLLCGRAMLAEEANACGLISRIVPLAELENEAFNTAAKIVQTPEFTAIALKETLKAFENPVYESAIDEAMMRARIIVGSDDFRNYLRKFSQNKA